MNESEEKGTPKKNFVKSMRNATSEGIKKVPSKSEIIESANSFMSKISNRYNKKESETEDSLSEPKDSFVNNTFHKTASGAKNLAERATGMKAIQDRKTAKTIKENAEKKYQVALDKTGEYRVILNYEIQKFGKIRLESLSKTVGVFISFLKRMNQNNKINQYDFLDEININQKEVEELDSLDMSAKDILRGTIASGSIGAVALAGVPILITKGVAALATASTGTAISSLSGAAATNAILAWLGGGAISAGGWGIAGGAIVLGGIKIASTGGLAILTAGIIASAHYSKKLTQAKEFEKDVDIKVGDMGKSWVVMDGVLQRIEELKDITNELTNRAIIELKTLEEIIPEFNTNDNYCKEVFQRCGLLVKSIGELARTPLFDEDGSFSDSSSVIIKKVKTILNTDLLSVEE